VRVPAAARVGLTPTWLPLIWRCSNARRMILPKLSLPALALSCRLGSDSLTRASNRDHDELRHSLRSALQYFRDSAKKFIILTSDFEFPVSYSPFKYLLGLQKRSHASGPTHAGNIARKRNVAVEYAEDYEDYDEPFATARLGLLPQWLVFDTEEEVNRTQHIGRWRDGDVSLEIIHHAEVFNQYDGTVFNRHVFCNFHECLLTST
jgi:hypothetical protein